MWSSICIVPIIALSLLVGAAARVDDVPSSTRSQDAIRRVKPGLQESLNGIGASYGSPIFIRVFKEEMELEVWVDTGEQFVMFRKYDVCACSGTLGPKTKEGDLQCPEGFYFVGKRDMNPSSSFHLSFNIGYPNEYDRQLSRTGSAIMVHGSCVSIGCFAMTDASIEEIYALADAALRGGQPFFRVHIFPFRMTQRNIEHHLGSQWDSFWLNLKAGYDYFETNARPPDVGVADGKYVFS
jgi:murein L,D-transpeptidase YafK